MPPPPAQMPSILTNAPDAPYFSILEGNVSILIGIDVGLGISSKETFKTVS
ncbi:Uncharacterised protein [Vibrio cholerae]|nr:Uncharacterised protein [Vibrio cholerae]